MSASLYPHANFHDRAVKSGITRGAHSSGALEFDRIPERNLDALRAVAVLCVLVNHVANVLLPGTFRTRPPELALYDSIGEAGVLIFFRVSAPRCSMS